MSSSRQQFTHGQRQQSGKSSFAQACNLLSQYIKDKGSVKGLNLEIGGKVESLEALVKSRSCASDKGKSSDLPTDQDPCKNLNSSINSAPYKPTSCKEAGKTDYQAAQLTIFYSGRVLVFDDIPKDKAKELMAFAKKGSTQMSYGIPSNTLREKTIPPAPSTNKLPMPQVSSPINDVPFNTWMETTNTAASGFGIEPWGSPQAVGLPIARRSSIDRFIDKRKDRGGTRGLYYYVGVHEQSSKGGDGYFDLNL